MTGSPSPLNTLSVVLRMPNDDTSAMTSENDNPYAPPAEVTEAPWSLPPDTEFLFNDDYVASIGTLELPRICVVNGERTGLIAMDSTLTAMPSIYRNAIRFLVGSIVAAFLVCLAMEFRPECFPVVIGILVFSLATPVVFMAGVRNRRKLNVRWYLSEAAKEKLGKERRKMLWFYAGTFLILFVIAIVLSLRLDASTVFVIILFGLPYHMLRRPAVLQSAGVFQGLVLVKGFKPPFISELRRMVDRSNASTPGSNPH